MPYALNLLILITQELEKRIGIPVVVSPIQGCLLCETSYYDIQLRHPFPLLLSDNLFWVRV